MARTVRERILAADHTLRVRDILLPEHTHRLSEPLLDLFLPMRITWIDNRVWGESFHLGDKVVRLGNRRGDHLTTHPHLHGLDEAEAEILLRYQIAGTLLHELGHAIVATLSPSYQEKVLTVATTLMKRKGLSTYGYGMPYKPEDPFAAEHECLAEAFRYWCHDDPKLRAEYPEWHDLVDVVNSRVHLLSSWRSKK